MKNQPLRPRIFQRSPLAVLLALALASAAPSAQALGFGRAQTTAVLGMPLDFRVGLRLDEGETLDPSCIASTVLVGESLVPQSAISIVLDGAGQTASMRVATTVPMTEPLVVVSITAGCSVRVTRRFTLFADPPGHRVMAPPAPPAAPVAPAPTPNGAAAPAQSLAFSLPAGVPPAPPTVLPLAPPSGNDLPSASTVTPTVPPAPPPAPATPAETAAAPAAPPPSPAQAPSASTAAAPASPAPRPAPRPAPTAPAPAAAAAPKPPAPAPKPPAPAAAAKPPTPQAASKPPASPAAKPAAPAPAPAAASRLKLEAPRISARVIDAAAAAEREAALRNAEEAAIAAKAAAEAAEARATQLERSIALLQEESKANREALMRLTQALEGSRSNELSPLLWAALAGLLGVSGFLLYRLRRLQSASREGWVRVSPEDEALAAGESDPGLKPLVPQAPAAEVAAVTGAPGAIAPADRESVESAFPAVSVPELPPSSTAGALTAASEVTGVSSGAAAPPLPSLSLSGLSDAGAPASALAALGEDSVTERTRLYPPSPVSVSPPIRPVSIEELLDLEQQVEFYTVLGQDDAALGLLVEHLRHTGGTYPLPFLKLMELYRRKGDADAYERMRDRFNQRFNAVAPAWGAPPMPERGLDDYPEVISQIQQAWAHPVDATALLENMLFRTQDGELFDLTALADVLFLFTLARDLLENESGEASTIDVLLPLSDSESLAGPLTAAPARPAMAASVVAGQGGPVLAGTGALAVGVSSGVAMRPSSSSGAVEDIDIPLGEPMLEPLFESPAEAAPPSATAPSPQAGPLDLDFGGELPSKASLPVAEVDRSLDFDLSDFDLPVATVTPAGQSASAVSGGSSMAPAGSPAPASPPKPSVDFNLDELSLEPAPTRRPREDDGPQGV